MMSFTLRAPSTLRDVARSAYFVVAFGVLLVVSVVLAADCLEEFRHSWADLKRHARSWWSDRWRGEVDD